MARIIDPNDHNKINQARHARSEYKPGWLGAVGDPCGYCCLTLWWIPDIDYSKKNPCPIILPNNKDYRKFCIDYTKSVLYGTNTIGGYGISKWKGFAYFRAAAKKLGFKSDGIPLESFKVGYIPTAAKHLSGLALCENYYETLRILANTNSPYQGKFGVDNYTWNATGYCGSNECDCLYPCSNSHITKKVWDGTSTGDCVCADPLVQVGDECFCEDAKYANNMSQKQAIFPKANDPRLYSVYPLGYCECKKQTIRSKKTRLISVPKDTNDCPDCECGKATVISEDKEYPIDSVWVRDTNDPPGSCRCDESLGLTSLLIDPDSTNDLFCKCSDMHYIWSDSENRCIPGSDYISWGSIDINQNFTDSENPFENDKQCIEPGDYVTYNIKFTIEDLRHADGATVGVSINLSNNLKLKEWYVESPSGGPNNIVINKDKFDQPNFSKEITIQSTVYPIKPIPTTITIGKHYKKNNFSPGLKHDYYSTNINLKHFAASSTSYEINYKIIAEIDLANYSTNQIFGVEVKLDSVDPYLFKNFRKTYINIGIGANSAFLNYAYDPDCEPTTETPSETPSESQTASG